MTSLPQVTIIPEIRLLTALTKLDVSENQIKVPHPPTHPPSSLLLQFLLRLNCLTRAQEFPEQLSDLCNLETLWAFKNKLGPPLPEWIGKLTSLTDLNLFNNGIMKLPDSMSNLVNMDQLNLAANKIIRVPSLDGMVNLKRLALFQNRISQMADLKTQSKLEKLEIYQNIMPQLPFCCAMFVPPRLPPSPFSLTPPLHAQP